MTLDLTTFLFELVNFLVLAAILTRFVYRPLAEGVRARREELARLRSEAAEKVAAAEARQEDLARRERELDGLRDQVMGEATASAAAERARILAQAREDAAGERARVQTLLEAERVAALGWVRDEAVERGVEVAGRLLLSLAPQAAHAALVGHLVAEVRGRAAADRPEEVELSLPRADDAESVERVRAALTEAFGAAPRLTVHEEPALGAGAVLRLGDLRLDASIAGQLEALRDEARRGLGAEA